MRNPLTLTATRTLSLLATTMLAFGVITAGSAHADGTTLLPVGSTASPSFLSSPSLSPVAGQVGESQPIINLDSATPIILPLHFSQGDETSLAGPTTLQHGVSFLYYNPGTGTDLAGNPLGLTTPSTYGFSNNLAAGDSHSGGLQMTGQVYLSSGSTAIVPNVVAPEQQQALSQNVAYTKGAFTFTGSVLQVDRNFSGDNALRTALAGGDQSSIDSVNAMLKNKGQSVQNFGMGYTASPDTSFKLTFNTDHNDIANKTTTDQQLSMTTGNIKQVKLGFVVEDKTDSSTLQDSHSVSMSLDRQLSSSLSLSANHTTVAMTGATNVTQTTNKIHIVLNPNRYGPSFDGTTIMQSDTAQGHDEQIALNVGQSVHGVNFGVNYATENQLVDGSSTEAQINTVGYQVAGKLNSMVSVSTNWKSITNSALASAQARLDTQNTTVNVAATKALLISDTFVNNNNVANGKLGATYTLANALGMIKPQVGFALLSQSGSATTSANGTGQTFDATLPAKNKLLAMLGDMTLHAEQDEYRSTGIAGGVEPYASGMRIFKVAAAPTVHRQFLWSYLMMAPYSSASQQAALRCIDVSLAVGHGYTVAYHDSDQQQQPNTTQLTNAKMRKLSIAGPIPHSKLKFTTDLSRSLSFCNSDRHHAAASFTLSSPTAANQQLALTLLRQFDELDSSGSNQSATYKLTYQLNVDPVTTFLVDGLVTTNQYADRPDLRDNTDATLKLNYNRAF